MYSRKTTWLVAGAVMLVAATAVAQSDDPFLRSLGKDQPVDRPGLARFMRGTASALENGRDAVAYLKRMAEDAVPGEQFRAKASAAMKERFSAYDEALKGFSAAARRLLEDPGSDRRLFAALVAGQHTRPDLGVVLAHQEHGAALGADARGRDIEDQAQQLVEIEGGVERVARLHQFLLPPKLPLQVHAGIL